MIRVGLITGWSDKCGITQYGHHMKQYIRDEDIKMEVVPQSLAEAASQAARFDIMVMNESGFTMSNFNKAAVDHIKSKAKLVLILHASNPDNNENDFTKMFDAVVHHELTAKDNYIKLPQGCPVNDIRGIMPFNPFTVGTNGFPLNHKNIPQLARACRETGMTLIGLLPDSHHASAGAMENNIRQTECKYHMVKEWLTDDQMIEYLADCEMVCYPYWNSTPGPSAAAMIGISSGRPVIVSRCNQFKHLFDYEDQIYFIESDAPSMEQIAQTITQVRQDILKGTERKPDKLYEQMNWSNVAKEYVKLFKGLVQ